MKKTLFRRALSVGAFTLLVVWAADGGSMASASFEGEGRVLGTVVDTNGVAIAGAAVNVTRPDAPNYKLEKTSNVKGQFTLLILDTTKSYKIRIEKAGYKTIETDLKPKPGDIIYETYTLTAN